MKRQVILSIALLGFLARTVSATDLTKIYPATLDFFAGQPAREWTCTKDDVWELKSFHYEQKGKLEIEAGPSNVVFGVNSKNVVWAVVLPDKPGTIKTKLEGNGEHVASIFMRFNPAHLGELFPASTVIGKGLPEMTIWGQRVCHAKIRDGWQANDLPVIPKKNSFILDVDTPEGKRIDYTYEKEVGAVTVCDKCAGGPVPPTVPLAPEKSLQAFDKVFEAFDTEYAKFVIRPDVDWKKLGEQYRKRAEKADSTYAAAAVISALVSELRDLHVWVKAGNEFVPGYNRVRRLNASWEGTKATFKDWVDTKHDVAWARTQDGIGYVNVYALGDQTATKEFDDVLEKLKDSRALVIDLRFNGGGDELLAKSIAGRFLDKKRMYSQNQYRAGKDHKELGNMIPREFDPRGPWRYSAPVVALFGQKTMSSAESFALMLAQCPNVTTMGERTAGASANPRRIDLECGIAVNLPRWIDYDPAGKSIEDNGVAPEMKADAPDDKFTAAKDPVLDAALDFLRKSPAGKRAPAKGG
jgi:hypothetical protein